MNILIEQPPNIDKIREVLNPPETACFAYGDTIYNPSGNELWLDILEHEKTHTKQQESFGSPALWWDEYLESPEYRQKCEVEAYAVQLSWVKSKRPEKVARKYLDLFAQQLSVLYKLDLTIHRAKTLIRIKAKDEKEAGGR